MSPGGAGSKAERWRPEEIIQKGSREPTDLISPRETNSPSSVEPRELVSPGETKCNGSREPDELVSLPSLPRQVDWSADARARMTDGYKALQDDAAAFRLDAEAGVWLRDGALHVKVVSREGDPVELTSTEARLLAQGLLRLAQALDDEDGR